MLSELIDVALDVADSCAPCSGNTPSSIIGPGSVGAGAASGTPGSDPGDPQPQGGGPEPGDKDYEKNLQRKNAKDTVFDLAWEIFTSPAGGLGKVLGPLGTVAAGAEPLAEGIANVQDSDVIREDRIYRDTQGAMGSPAPSAGGGDSAPAPSAENTGGDSRDSSMSEADAEAQAQFERTMENIRIREEVRQAGNAGNDSWKNWR